MVRVTHVVSVLAITSLGCPAFDEKSNTVASPPQAEDENVTTTTNQISTLLNTTGDATTTTVEECIETEELLQSDGSPSGWWNCEDGGVVRKTAVECTQPKGETECLPTTPEQDICSADSDCAENAYGTCLLNDHFGDGGFCYCSYGCKSDMDCGENQVCACSGVWGNSESTCIPAPCATNDACDSGRCEAWRHDTGEEDVLNLACLTENAECTPAQGCPETFEECVSQAPDYTWTCDSLPIQ